MIIDCYLNAKANRLLPPGSNRMLFVTNPNNKSTFQINGLFKINKRQLFYLSGFGTDYNKFCYGFLVLQIRFL